MIHRAVVHTPLKRFPTAFLLRFKVTETCLGEDNVLHRGPGTGHNSESPQKESPREQKRGLWSTAEASEAPRA